MSPKSCKGCSGCPRWKAKTSPAGLVSAAAAPSGGSANVPIGFRRFAAPLRHSSLTPTILFVAANREEVAGRRHRPARAAGIPGGDDRGAADRDRLGQRLQRRPTRRPPDILGANIVGSDVVG